MSTFPEGTYPYLAINEQPAPAINILMGPSAIGKSTIINGLLTIKPEFYAYPTMYVTRPLRCGEINKISITEQEYTKIKASNDIIVNDLYPVKYALTKSEINDYLDKGVSLLIDWALESITSFNTVHHPLRRIYITTPTIEEWLERIRNAGRSQDRVANGLTELTQLFITNFSHPDIDYIVTNKNGAIKETLATVSHLFRTSRPVRIG